MKLRGMRRSINISPLRGVLQPLTQSNQRDDFCSKAAPSRSALARQQRKRAVHCCQWLPVTFDFDVLQRRKNLFVGRSPVVAPKKTNASEG